MANYVFVETVQLTEAEKFQIMMLWNQEYPVKLAFDGLKAFEDYYLALKYPTHILLKEGDNILGWGVKFERDEKRWFAIILSGKLHHQGFGALILGRLKQGETVLSGWVVDHNKDEKADGAPYVSPLGFYLKQGFKLIVGERLELSTLSAAKIVWIKD